MNEVIAPARTDRWNIFWDAWSSALPDSTFQTMSEIDLSDLTAKAWKEFEQQDITAQASAIAKAWGIVQSMPKRRQRKPPAKAVVIPPRRWEPCPYWRGEPCLIHKHAMQETSMAKAQSLFELHSRYVRRRIFVELAPFRNRGFDVIEVEGLVWFAVARRMPEYLPLLDTYYISPEPETSDIGVWVTDSSKQSQARAQMWLRSVVHTVVKDVVRNNFNAKRDVRQTDPLPDYAGDRGIANPLEPGFAQPTPPANAWEAAREAQED